MGEDPGAEEKRLAAGSQLAAGLLGRPLLVWQALAWPVGCDGAMAERMDETPRATTSDNEGRADPPKEGGSMVKSSREFGVGAKPGQGCSEDLEADNRNENERLMMKQKGLSFGPLGNQPGQALYFERNAPPPCSTWVAQKCGFLREGGGHGWRLDTSRAAKRGSRVDGGGG